MIERQHQQTSKLAALHGSEIEFLSKLKDAFDAVLLDCTRAKEGEKEARAEAEALGVQIEVRQLRLDEVELEVSAERS